MTQWHRTLKGDLGLRPAGTVLLAISYVSIRSVFHRHALDPAHWSPGVVVYALTTIGFLSASLGSAMVMVGHHIFDRIEISERWQPRRGEAPRPKPYLGYAPKHQDGPFITSITSSATTVRSPRADDARQRRIPGGRSHSDGSELLSVHRLAG